MDNKLNSNDVAFLSNTLIVSYQGTEKLYQYVENNNLRVLQNDLRTILQLDFNTSDNLAKLIFDSPGQSQYNL